MKQFKITLHSDDTECIVTANDEDEAEEKYWNGEIDEFLTPEWEQPSVIIKEIGEG